MLGSVVFDASGTSNVSESWQLRSILKLSWSMSCLGISSIALKETKSGFWLWQVSEAF